MNVFVNFQAMLLFFFCLCALCLFIYHMRQRNKWTKICHFGSLVMWHGLSWSQWSSHAAAFWIICRGLISHDVNPARRALQKYSLEMTSAWTRSCASCSDRKGLILLMLCSANLHDQTDFEMWPLKISCSSNMTSKILTFLADLIDWTILKYRVV